MSLPPRFEQRLDAAPWADLAHLEGPATDIPPLLCALFDADPTASHRAARYLGELLCPDGQIVFDATREALPFVVEALQRTAGSTQAELVDLLCDVTHATAGMLDPWRAVRRLPGAERLLPGTRLERGSEHGIAGACRRAVLAALPELAALAMRPADGRSELAPRIARIAESLAHTTDAARAECVRVLRVAYDGSAARARAAWLVALAHLDATASIAEPDDACTRWIWLAASQERAPALRSVLLDTPSEEITEFDALGIGVRFFPGLGAPLVDVAPELQLRIAERWVHYVKTRLAGEAASPHRSAGLGVESLVFAFVGGVLPADLATFQVDLLELLYRDTFIKGVTRSNALMELRRLGAPTLRREASDFLVAHARARLPE